MRNLNRLHELDKYLAEHFHVSFGNRIMKQIMSYIPVYIASGGDELEALDDILSKKVFRKLEAQNPIYLRSSVADLLEFLDKLFGKNNIPLSTEVILKILRNA